MNTKIIEASNGKAGGINWGKFMIGRFDADEWARRSEISDDESFIPSRSPLLSRVGWEPKHLLVLDLQTGEGAVFRPGGSASADLHKHKIWVCPLFEPFLTWLWRQDVTDINKLPSVVHLDAPSAIYGYRREGPQTE